MSERDARQMFSTFNDVIKISRYFAHFSDFSESALRNSTFQRVTRKSARKLTCVGHLAWLTCLLSNCGSESRGDDVFCRDFVTGSLEKKSARGECGPYSRCDSNGTQNAPIAGPISRAECLWADCTDARRQVRWGRAFCVRGARD